MAWYISEDKIDDGQAVGQWNARFKNPENGIEKCKEICTYKFRMLDDDDEVYYIGYSNDCDSEKAFQPLDDFGMPNAGCTDIQYRHNGKWESL
ncbi:MAG: hypothetical protein GQ474_00550 [Sulfurimonas sp.]|nr:hypothetical protein [Sulfurimonas sp.]